MNCCRWRRIEGASLDCTLKDWPASINSGGSRKFGRSNGLCGSVAILCYRFRRHHLAFSNQARHTLAHDRSPGVHVALRIPDDMNVRSEFEPVEHHPRRLGHDRAHSGDDGVYSVQRRTDQHRVVDGRADLNLALGRETASQAQHLGAVGLHREVAQRPRVWVFANMAMPAEHGVQRASEHGQVDCAV